MGWSIGYDPTWKRDIGYGVPAFCDHPKCNEVIDRGLSQVCGGEPYGGDHGCGLFFCDNHLNWSVRCPRCAAGHRSTPYKNPKPEHPDWISHKLNDKSWAKWRAENPVEVARLTAALTPKGIRKPADTESDNG